MSDARPEPEMLLGDQLYGAPLDMWAFGCIFCELRLAAGYDQYLWLTITLTNDTWHEQLGNRAHEFLNAFVTAVETNRTLL